MVPTRRSCGGGYTGGYGPVLGQGGIQTGSGEQGQGCRGGDAGFFGGLAFCEQTELSCPQGRAGEARPLNSLGAE